MKPTMMLLLLAVGSTLAGCAGSVKYTAVPPRLDPPPPAIDVPCAGPVALPDRALKSGEVQKFWFKDRGALVTCGERRDALSRFYKDRDAGLRGVP